MLGSLTLLLAPWSPVAAQVVAPPATVDWQQPAEPRIPEPLKAMLDAALASGNEGEVATIVKYARVAAPDSADRILAIADAWRGRLAAERDRSLRRAGPFEMWRGRAEIGGWLTSGNSETVGATGVLDVTREGVRWRHNVKLQADYQESLGVATREHYLAAYEPNFKIGPRSYIYGAAQYESDRFLGYTDRLSASLGLGYSAIREPSITLDVELGPAYRYAQLTDETIENSIAARGSIDLDWRLTPGITLTQDASAYLERYNSTIAATTAINARLIGPLSAQLSYAVQYESTPTDGRVTTDTTSRAGLVYSF